MTHATGSPSLIARDTLKMLAQRKLAPTPENYAHIYAEISGERNETNAESVLSEIAEQLQNTPKAMAAGIALKKSIKEKNWAQAQLEIAKLLPKNSDEGDAKSWSGLIRDLLRQLEATHKGLTVARKKEGLDTVLARFGSNPETLFDKLSGLIRSWAETPASAPPLEVEVAEPATSVNPTSSAAVTPSAASTPTTAVSDMENGSNVDAEMLSNLAELLAQTLESTLSAQPEMASEVAKLTEQVRTLKTHDQVTLLAKQLRQFWLKIELRGGDKAKIQEGLVRLLRLLVENVGEMVEDEEWLHGQITTLHEIIGNPIDKHVIADAERSLREAIIKQSLLKQSLNDAKSTLKSLMTTFIDRLGEISASTGDYHHKIQGYSEKIVQSNNLTDLGHLLDDIMQDTRIIQASALRSHEELIGSRQQVQEAESKIRKLEQELAQVSELVHHDQLTGALNRRGMDEAFEREAKRTERSKLPLCVSLLDIDNFKRLNDTMGHQIGDQALVHLCNIIKEALRPTDSVARYGGEEFVIILPEVGLEEAALTIERLQRELTKKYFLHENDKVLVTFSAGVAQRQSDESQEEVIGRADKAMYKAKQTGKNRVVVAK